MIWLNKWTVKKDQGFLFVMELLEVICGDFMPLVHILESFHFQ